MINELAGGQKQDPIILVSGLPRSGTSMMMQMLDAGGLPIVTDRIRKADEDNPKGYYELEKVKHMRDDTAWLNDCNGKVIKMISALLHQLPSDKSFKMVFMKRDLDEVLASQTVMLKRLGRKGANLSNEEMIEKYKSHLTHVTNWLSGKNNFDVIYINFQDAIQNTHETALKISKFLNKQMDLKAMVKTVEKKLYRQKSRAGS